MKLKYMLLALMPLCLASCSEEENIAPDGQRQEVRVTAGVGNDSRMVLSDQGTYFSCLWENSDRISLFTTTQSNLVYRTTIDGNVATAAFTPVDEALEDRDGNTVYGCYPDATLAEGEGLVVNLPSTSIMDYNNGTLRSFAYAKSTISNGKVDFKFKHISAFLGLTVTSDMLSDASKGISKVTVSTSSTEPLSIGEGDTFDFSTLEASTTHGSNTVQMNVDNLVVETEWTIYVPILPQPSGADITITLSDSEGSTLYTITKQTPEAGFQAGYAYHQGAIVSSDVAYLIDGPTFNANIKDLVNGNTESRATYDSDYNIARIKFMTEVEALPEEYIIVSAEDSPVPIYASFNATDSLLTISTAAKSMEIVDASYMFQELLFLHTIDLGNFKITEKTTNMEGMFFDCRSLISLDVAEWNTENVTDMSDMFVYCFDLSTLDVSNWNTANVTDMNEMFSCCHSIVTLDVSKWNTVKVINMEDLFVECINLKTLDVSNWDTSNVTNMAYLFGGCNDLLVLDVSNWKTEKVTDMGGLFSDCSSLTVLDVSKWNTANVTDMSAMFAGLSLTTLDLSNLNTSKVTDMFEMFHGTSALTVLDVSNWDTSNVTEISDMFSGCSSLASLDVSNWNTSKVTDMRHTFYGCSALTALDLSNWSTLNVTDLAYMFGSCTSLTILNLCNWNVEKVMYMDGMLEDCKKLTQLNLSNWVFNENMYLNDMFMNCAYDSQSCKIITTLDAKEFLLGKTGITGMNPDWFIWEEDGTSIEDMPKEEW